jgi:glycerol-3-phosphate dehydrogenase
MRDVCVVGAGIAGCACAHFLSAYDLDVVVVDAAYDISCGTTRANSGIVHSGYDPKPGTAKARYNVAGSRMYPQLAEDLGFEFKQCGSLIVAFSEDERPAIEELLQRGRANGVEGLRIMEADELHAKEPNLNPDAVAALWAPTGGIVDPYGACLAFAENAAVNGVEFRFNTHVDAIRPMKGGWRLAVHRTQGTDTQADAEADVSGVDATSAAKDVDGDAPGRDTIEAHIVINAAGLESGRVNGMVSRAEDIHITPRAGEYLLLDNVWGGAFSSTIFQVPTAKGKGVLVTPTVEGNIMVGPDAVVREGIEDRYTTAEGLDGVVAAAKKTWPKLPARDAITNFAGLRASCVEAPDFHLGEPADAPGFFNIAGFDSPGLTAAPAVAAEYARTIAERLGAREKADFVGHREAPKHFKRLTDEEREGLIAQDPAWGRIICRCECVSEAEIVAAIHSPVPATTTDAIKWRTRAGMGRCQAGFCLPLTAQIIARELGIDPADVCKNGAGSPLAFGHRGVWDRLPEVSMEGGER